MSQRDKYNPDYKKLYPGIEISPEILEVLEKSDRKMEYMEVDLKTETFVYDADRKIARFLPSREDSYNRLLGEDQQFATSEDSVEMVTLRKTQIQRLRQILPMLEPEEAALIHTLYFENVSERQLAKQSNTPYMTIHNRKRRILAKLLKLMEK